eukprot:CAMPEP_0194087226 /NCGR_PEP_ID=MMETSP0149-20130528/24060_1 /TAXON_ID=122233 /ORGANISM="Chaetoceros debilis, Strain MM31A-1" /LENGTH=73 /DNA_ID=CAMNT_0038770513 /DNA_START=19 /DNA_END=240 /DNA_ORIENTATION=+
MSSGWSYVDLSGGCKAAVAALGYTEESWNSGQTPPECNKLYADLTDEQQDAVATLGYSKDSWDGTKEKVRTEI